MSDFEVHNHQDRGMKFIGGFHKFRGVNSRRDPHEYNVDEGHDCNDNGGAMMAAVSALMCSGWL